MGGICYKDATNFCQAVHRAEPVGGAAQNLSFLPGRLCSTNALGALKNELR